MADSQGPRVDLEVEVEVEVEVDRPLLASSNPTAFALDFVVPVAFALDFDFVVPIAFALDVNFAVPPQDPSPCTV